MRLYVKDKNNKKVFLKLTAPTKLELVQKLGTPYFTIDNETYHVSQVTAELNGSNTAGGAILGGILGLITGGTGVLIGGLAGGILGGISDSDEEKKVTIFNQSSFKWPS